MAIVTLAPASAALLACLVPFVLLLYRSLRQTPWPFINDYPRDVFRRKARREYETNAKDLLAKGLAQHGGPFGIFTTQGPKLILPPKHIDWVKANKDLDHSAQAQDDFLAGYAGFEGQTALHHEGRLLMDVIKAKLSKNEHNVATLTAHLEDALQDLWRSGQAWHAVDWFQDTTAIISRAAASVFVGPRLGRSQQWQDISVNYVLGYFTGVMEVRQWPRWLRPLVHYFNPSSRSCRSLVEQGRAMLDDELARRDRERQKAQREGTALPVYADAIEWVSAAAGDRPVDHGALQLGLGVAALFTTAEALRQTVLEICSHGDLVLPLREEVEQAVHESGWTMNALMKMKLLDSVMKEAQRTSPALVGLERKALRDTVHPDGFTIPNGTHIAVDASLMWSPTEYSSPETFDGRRYLKLRETGGDPTNVFASSNRQHITFGLGRSICPGRFFADTELKLCLAHMLLKYDVRFQEGYSPPSLYSGFFHMVDPAAQIEVRRRQT